MPFRPRLPTAVINRYRTILTERVGYNSEILKKFDQARARSAPIERQLQNDYSRFRNRLNEQLAEALPQTVLHRYLVTSIKEQGLNRFGLKLEPEQMELHRD